jgi:hypothetical protein
MNGFANYESMRAMPDWVKENLDKIMNGDAVVVGDAWFNHVEGINILDGIVSIPNLKRVGTKDRYLAGLPSNPQIRAYRVEMELE